MGYFVGKHENLHPRLHEDGRPINDHINLNWILGTDNPVAGRDILPNVHHAIFDLVLVRGLFHLQIASTLNLGIALRSSTGTYRQVSTGNAKQ